MLPPSSLNESSAPVWLTEQVYQPKRQRTVDLVHESIDALRKAQARISLASIAAKSRELDSDCNAALSMAANERKRWYDFYGYDAIDSAILAKQEKRLFVSEDMCLRHRVKHSFAVNSVWTQPLLEHLVSTKHIPHEKYQKLIIQ